MSLDTTYPSALVIIVAYNSGEVLQKAVDALSAQSLANFQAVIWDNGSQDDAMNGLRCDGRFFVKSNSENVGFAAANNRASRLFRSKYIVTLNPDAFPESTWLERILAAAERSGADAIASLQLNDAEPERLDGAGDCMSIAGIAWRGGYMCEREAAPHQISEVFAPCAAAALYRRDAFEALGGFDERFFCYYEDVDLGFRIRLAGGKTLLEPRAVVRHVGSSSTGMQSHFSEYHGARNRLWTFIKNMPTVLLPLAAPLHVLAIAYVLLRSPRLLRPRWQGILDGWSGRAPFIRERRKTGAIGPLLKVLTWSPLALSRRKIKARAVSL